MLRLRTWSSYSPHKNAHAVLLTVSNRWSGCRPWVVTVQPIHYETQTAKGLRRHLVSLGFNPDYLWIICPICLIGIQMSLGLFIFLCWVDVCLPSRWKKAAPQRLWSHSPAASSLLLLSSAHFFFILPGIGAPCGDARIRSETGCESGCRGPSAHPEAERNSQERAAHYPTLWLLQKRAD